MGINPWVATDADGQIWFSKGGQVGVVRDGQLVKRLDYTLVRFIEKLDDALFTYSPPPGASVIEINRIAQEALRHSGMQLPP